MTVYFYGVFEFQGGMENYAKNLITGVLEKDKSIRFAIIKDRPFIAYEDYFASLGCDIITIPNQKQHPLRYYKALKRICLSAKEANDLVQLNVMSFRNLFLFQAFKISKAKGIIVAHGAGIAGTPLRFLHILLRPFFKHVGQQVAISKEAAAFQFGKNNRAKIIPNAIDPRPFAFSLKAREQVRRSFGIASRTLLLGQVGRICPIKNQIFSIRLLKALLERGVDARLCMIGAIQDSAPTKLVKDLRLEERAIFVGETKPAEYYSAFDLLLLPSLSEGAGLVLYESEANGLPSVISANVPIKNQQNLVLPLPLELNAWVNVIVERHHERAKKVLSTDAYTAFCRTYINLYALL